MYNPGVTYRIQFNKDFNFSAFEKAVGYLHQLGITTIYASPIFDAVPGSMHGYDVTNPNAINKEIGTMSQLENLAAQLQPRGMGWLQDIVPNHMAYHQQNEWLMDVLQYGPASRYADYFDIDWNYPMNPGKVMLPILDKPLDEAIEAGDIKLEYADGKLWLNYRGANYPLRADSYSSMPENEGNRKTWTDDTNNNKEAVRQIADRQYYRLCAWQETDQHINYRRFFTINGMICVNIQNQQVFDDHHKLVKQLTDSNIIQGLRIDHIDGLYDPTEYLYRLRALAGENAYITVEKILEPGENLPPYWPVQGTTGYDFIALVNGLFTGQDSEKTLTAFYNRITNKKDRLDKQLHDKKALILNNYMHGELENLTQLLQDIIEDEHMQQDKLMSAIAAFLIYCPVYRYYSAKMPVDEKENARLRKVFSEIKHTHKDIDFEITLLEHVLLELPYNQTNGSNEKIAHFFKRCMQLTGPLMAKGVEDTLMYTYNREIAHNEVGDSPAMVISSTDEFHKAILKRRKRWPHTMNATATHDTKHGEDARARLHVLFDIADEWVQTVDKWHTLNELHRQNGVPGYNEEYFIYQALIASYPMPEQNKDDFTNRFQAYIQKALREAKVHTNWTNPDTDYENAVASFIDNLLKEGTTFMQEFLQMHEKIADAGIVNSLVQLTLKCTTPGIPDIYQGCDLWDLSMVDPDNRRPVNYELRASWLYEITSHKDQDYLPALWDDRYSGKIKLWLLHHLLRLRSRYKELFAEGAYVPLATTGKYKDNIIAYMRSYKDECCVIILPLHTAQLGNIEDIDWEDTAVKLTENIAGKYEHVFSGTSVKANNTLQVKDVFTPLPFAVLHGGIQENKRAAGVLLPVFSLPSPFGIGDFGSCAKAFINFLNRSKQKYWQILPLNPVDGGSMYSPYSSMSSMACNPLLISPELLAKEKLIDKKELSNYHAKGNKKVDYTAAEKIKYALIDEAYNNYCSKNYTALTYAFDEFCKKEHDWLEDYALFMALKYVHDNQPWYQWPEDYKLRNEHALSEFAAQQQGALHKIKWIQFITERQWQQVRGYCADMQVKLFGDLPFYVSYDSVDVWSHPEIFNLNEKGNMIGVAGVPPDYFSADGQLWGVPTFNWDKLKESNYDWWVKRLKKNIALFDLVRIDHFRALETYWQVPAGETTAKNGKWLKGPGAEFFDAMQKALGTIPFVAEDLGWEMEDVYVLREKIGLPGMKVLQYAWGDNICTSVDIPHNYTTNCIAYTGTHDNNTTIGWYKNETGGDDHKRMKAYTGRDINVNNVHEALAAIAYASVAKIAILPMQDILGLDEHARMNTPGTIVNNWQWRLPADAINDGVIKYLKRLTTLYNRR